MKNFGAQKRVISERKIVTHYYGIGTALSKSEVYKNEYWNDILDEIVTARHIYFFNKNQ